MVVKEGYYYFQFPLSGGVRIGQVCKDRRCDYHIFGCGDEQGWPISDVIIIKRVPQAKPKPAK